MEDRYSCKCPICETEFNAEKSIAQELGILDAGYGKCIKCNTFLNLTVDGENKRMIVTPWDIYSKQKRWDIDE